MQSPLSSSAGPAPRRFLLVAEEVLDAAGRRPRIRRYRLASLGSRAAVKAGRPIPQMGRPGELAARI